ncbi:MAG: DUF502 domain-containing protein [Candidatus Brocadiia bacterium]
MKKMLGYFIKGLLFIVPIAATVYVLYLVFNWVDGLLHIPLPGVGFVATILLVTAVGYLLSGIFAGSILNLIDRAFKHIPLIKLIYTSIKDLTGAFTGEKKMFDRPVLVSLSSESSVRVLGFITRDDLAELGLSASRPTGQAGLDLKDHVAVYVPQAYNFAGNLIIVCKDQVTPINKNGPEVMKFIVSAGISGSSADAK